VTEDRKRTLTKKEEGVMVVVGVLWAIDQVRAEEGEPKPLHPWKIPLKTIVEVLGGEGVINSRAVGRYVTELRLSRRDINGRRAVLVAQEPSTATIKRLISGLSMSNKPGVVWMEHLPERLIKEIWKILEIRQLMLAQDRVKPSFDEKTQAALDDLRRLRDAVPDPEEVKV